ncbi:MAG: hypothetical protein EBR06_06115, partial [Acidimicrobiia bacterium]|nr:hypothetical protein [Acidimicrobiia bacterium]
MRHVERDCLQHARSQRRAQKALFDDERVLEFECGSFERHTSTFVVAWRQERVRHRFARPEREHEIAQRTASLLQRRETARLCRLRHLLAKCVVSHVA